MKSEKSPSGASSGPGNTSASGARSPESTTSGKPGRKHTEDRNFKRHLLRSKLIAEKGGNCERCQRAFHPQVMVFHHRSAEDKQLPLNAAVLTDMSWNKILAEAKRCHLLCSNCHKEVHAYKDLRFLDIPEDETQYP